MNASRIFFPMWVVFGMFVVFGIISKVSDRSDHYAGAKHVPFPRAEGRPDVVAQRVRRTVAPGSVATPSTRTRSDEITAAKASGALAVDTRTRGKRPLDLRAVKPKQVAQVPSALRPSHHDKRQVRSVSETHSQRSTATATLARRTGIVETSHTAVSETALLDKNVDGPKVPPLPERGTRARTTTKSDQDASLSVTHKSVPLPVQRNRKKRRRLRKSAHGAYSRNRPGGPWSGTRVKHSKRTQHRAYAGVRPAKRLALARRKAAQRTRRIRRAAN